jgi:5-methylcytosine-specific restriction enzyme A
MATYILTWNPEKWTWSPEDYAEEVSVTRRGKLFPTGWSCGNTKSIVSGDRVFLFRQHTQRGIISSGYATSDVYEGERWNPSLKRKKALRVDYKSDTLLPVEQRLPVEELVTADLGVPWNNLMASGVSVPDEDARRLEKLWRRHLFQVGRKSRKSVELPEELPRRKYVEGATRRVIVDAYERNSKARRRCLEYYGSRCVVCDFGFREAYGDIGDGIHVHHLRDIASIGRYYRINPIKGLRPVCPNCHAILHQTKPAMTIERLREIVARCKGNARGR